MVGLWWAQDGAPAHHHIIVRNRLNEDFNNRVIAPGHPPRSPDPGYIKNMVLTTLPRKLNDPRNRTFTEFNELKQRRQIIISKSVKAMKRRAELCVERNGGHVEGHG